MSMGSTLSQYIHDCGMTKKKFAEDIGFSEGALYAWCNDKHPIPLDKIALLGEYFSEVTGSPPNVIMFRLILQHPTVRAVLDSYQKANQK